jgi:ATP-dependent helicase HrpA
MIREKATWYLKALPKAWRSRIMIGPELVTAFLEANPSSKQDGRSLPDAVAAFVAARIGESVPPGLWEGTEVPLHLRINVRVVDAAGKELNEGRDLEALRLQLGEAAQLTFAAAGAEFERSGITRWDFGDLPETLAIRRAGAQRQGYPALVAQDNGIALRLMDTRAAADAATRVAVVRLIGIQLKDALRRWAKDPPGFAQAALLLKPAIATDRLLDDVLAAICDRAFVGDDALPRSEAAFAEQLKRARTRLPAVAEGAFRLLATIAGEYHALSQRIATLAKAQARLGAELRAQRDALVHPGFFQASPWNQLGHVPRYLKALERRLAKYSENPGRDDKHAQAVAILWERYRERAEANRVRQRVDPALDAFRWQLEELKVSLFAQELKTPLPVSYKRLEKAWTDLLREK